MVVFSRWKLLACLLVLSPLCQAATVEDTWPQKCRELKQKYLTDPVLKITFSKKPDIKAKLATWRLDWQGLALSLPQTQYDSVSISRDVEGNHAIQLGDSQHNIKLTLQQHAASDDALQSGKRQMTRFDLTLLGYTKTPNDLSCQEGSWAREAPVADALIMKAVDLRGELQAVYREDTNHPGWTLKLANDKQVTFHSYRRQAGAEQLLQILYTTPQGNAARVLGYHLGTAAKDKPASSPEWLAALQKAINTNKQDDWRNFFRLAAQAGFDQKQLEHSKTQLGL